MESCDLTQDNGTARWSIEQPNGSTHPTASNSHVYYQQSNVSGQNQPYRPLAQHQQQYQQQSQWGHPHSHSPNPQQQSSSQCPPYRPLSASGYQNQGPAYQPTRDTGFSGAGYSQSHHHSGYNSGSSNSLSRCSDSGWSQGGNSMRQPSPNSSWGGGAAVAGSSSWGGAGSSNAYYPQQGRGGGMRADGPGGYRGGQGMRTDSPAYYGSSRGMQTVSPGGGYGGRGAMRSGSPGFGGRGGFGGGGPRPSVPPPWIKQDCWLVPKPGSVEEAAFRAAAAAARAAARQSAVAAAAVTAVTGTAGAGGAAAVVVATAAAGAAGVGRNSSRVVIIMRGLPGSGKSTRAAELAEEARQAAAAVAGSSSVIPASAVAIHSTDSYFLDASGTYVFNPELLSINHQKNFDAFAASLAAGMGTVIVDNTNLQPWQFEKYVTSAWAAGYRVREEVVGEFTEAAAAEYAARNTHGVPHDKILIMLDQWRRQ